MDGLEVFMRNLPPGLTDQGLTAQLMPHVNRLNITDWTCQKPRGKKFGTITFLHRTDGDTFLRFHCEQSVPGQTRAGHPRTRARLMLLNTPVYCKQSEHTPDAFLLKTLVKAAEDRKREKEEVQQEVRTNTNVTFELRNFQCGHYEYPNDSLAYTPDLQWRADGIVKFARDALVSTFSVPYTGAVRVEMPYRTIHDVVICRRPPSLLLTLWEAPRFFQLGSHTDDDQMADMMGWMGLAPSLNLALSDGAARTRLSALPHDSASHREVVGQSLIYRLEVSAYNFSPRVDELQKWKDHLSLSYHNFPNTAYKPTYMADGLFGFKTTLNECSPTMPFDILFQLQALVQNGYLLPQTVTQLLTRFRAIMKANPGLSTLPFSAGAVKKLFSQIPFPGPETEANTFDVDEIWTFLEANEKEIRQGIAKELISERARQNLTMVYKVQVTPSRIILNGPEPEAKNRILRKFPHHTGYFARVQFCEEDGQDVFFNAKVSLDEVYQRFKEVLLKGVQIAGRVYKFLGFSHSSLRAHAVWFMAAFVDHEGHPQTYLSVIKDLGRFKEITSPARCAARIGQAFSETPFSIDLEKHGAHIEYIPDVKSSDGSRVFSDGVGTVSRDLMEAIQAELPHKRSPTTCFQIRWAGAKGMLSLDNTLEGMVMRIRPESMVKFKSNDTQNLEICDVANKPIPLVLNRQMIKILEDMGVPEMWFFEMQNRELNRLRKITALTDNTVTFLKRQKVADQIRFSQFIHRLHKLGIDYKKDPFLCSVVEAVVLREVRLLKHKARIPVEHGVTLFGVMDEFGILDEDEVYVTFDKLQGMNPSDLHGRAVIVTRSPALHPGDIQIRTAVVPPCGHPLRELSNCIVFSQKGERDLPSQLSGGDLDGDIYNIIWDHEAVDKCKLEFAPADYPRVPPLNIGREVTADDMTDFFVNFMATDQLGVIAIKHIILADMHVAGTVHIECQVLAQMHSTGVDYSKTGIAVDMGQLRRLTRTRYRPDFLSPAPPANIVGRSEISFEPPVARSDNIDEDDDAGPKHAYYSSDKILGKLYRAIDEKKIWKEDIHLTVNHIGATVWDQVLLHIKHECEEIGGVNWQAALGEARRIRQAYDDAIWNASIDFSDHSSVGITELEVFTGCIFNKSGVQTRRQRDKSTRLKDEFDRISKWVESLIRKQDMRSLDDEDEEDSDQDTSQRTSALELSIACVHVGTFKVDVMQGARRGGVDYESFKTVAASCALRELEYAITQAEVAAGAAVVGGGYIGVANGKY